MQKFGPAVAFPCIPCSSTHQSTAVRLSAAAPSPAAENDEMQPPLRQCQRDCLAACAQGARVIEMACGTGKTRVIEELASNVSGKVPFSVDSIQFRLIPMLCHCCLVGIYFICLVDMVVLCHSCLCFVIASRGRGRSSSLLTKRPETSERVSRGTLIVPCYAIFRF